MLNTCKLLFQKMLRNVVDLGRTISEELRKKNNGQVVMASGFTATLIIVAGIFMFATGFDYDQKSDDAVLEENIFELDLDDSVKSELKKGFESFYGTVSDNHVDVISENIKDNFVPFGVDVYEVLSNKKDKPVSIEENPNELVMADNVKSDLEDNASQNAQQEGAGQQPVAETQPVTEAPTEPATEPATEPVTEPVTEPPTEPQTQEVVQEVEQPVQISQEVTIFSVNLNDNEISGYNDNAVTVNYSGYVWSISDDDYYWLKQIVEAEAGNQDDVGKILVANVILNRVNSSSFPDSITEVIFQSRGSVYQFQPAKNGMVYSVTPSDNTISCVDRALSGEDYSQGALYFAQQSSRYSWFNTSLTFLFVHGAHYFYR